MLWCSLKQRNTFAHRAAYSGDCISLVTHPFYPDKRGDKIFMAIPHNSKCRYGERGAAAAKPKAQIILDAAKVGAASGGNSEPKQRQRSQSARGFCPRSTMRVPQPDIIEHFGNADAVPQPPERCLSRQAGIVRCCLYFLAYTNSIPQFCAKEKQGRAAFAAKQQKAKHSPAKWLILPQFQRRTLQSARAPKTAF